METNKKTSFNDNFSDFLNEYNDQSGKKEWIGNKLGIIDKQLDDLGKADDEVKDAINVTRDVLSNDALDPSQKVIISIKGINDFITKQDPDPKDIMMTNALRTIISTYIDIARYTSDEVIAREVVNLGNNLYK
ncbi:MAG TPA: hypothetical protein VK623_10780 [Flavobacterium sp.]|nr:hypothetical protein [Flavobacterium sp.]